MKKLICICMCLLTLLPFGMTAFAGELPGIPLTTASTRLAGDANKDGAVGLQDVAVMVRHLAGGWGVTINEKNADVNGDNVVDLKDVVILRRYLAHWDGVTLK